MNSKKIAGLVLAVVLLFAAILGVCIAVSASQVTSGDCGKNITWNYTDDGTLTISGEGMMNNYSYDGMPWYHLKNQVTKVVIGEGVTHVGELAFYGFSAITEVSLPESTVSIGRYAFYSCSGLKSVTIPEGVVSIGQYAFRKTDLKTATMPSDGWTVRGNAMSGLEGAEEAAKLLTSTEVGYFFYLYDWKRTVEVDEVVVVYSGECGKDLTWALYSDGLFEVSGNGDMKDYGAFKTPWEEYKNRINRIVIGEGVTSVGYCAFYGCTELFSVELPETLVEIDRYAFYDCRALGAVTVPEAVEYIGEYAFRKCFGMSAITLIKTEGWTAGGKPLDSEELKDGEYVWKLLAKEDYKKPWKSSCLHEYVQSIEVIATTFEEGKAVYTCTKCGEGYDEIIPATKSLKLLAIGNSFSEDAFDHLYIICKDAGIEELIIGNLYIGGCSLENHYKQMSNEADAYIFYLGDDETKTMVKQNGGTKCNAKVGLTYTDWDYITLQQNSANSGRAETYEYLDDVIAYVKQYANADAQFLWHMTWAYQADSTSTNFAYYNYDQMTMYNAILDCVQNVVLQNPDIKGVIPSGTAVQNLRTGHLGDTVTDDGRHLSKGVGRYTAGLTYLAAITGYDVTSITAVPNLDSYPNYSASRKEDLRKVADHLDCIKEAVISAVASPFAITPSVKFPYVPVEPEVPEMPDENESILNTTLSALTDSDREYLISKGYDPDHYMFLDLTVKANAYYDSSKTSFSGNLYTPSSGSTYLKFLGTQSFTRNELVVGTLIRIDAGYKYRPEGWTTGVQNASSDRPGIVYSAANELTVVTDEWWGDWEYRGFNICKGTTSSNQDITIDEKDNFKIYIPVATKSALNADDIAYLKSLGLDPSGYMALDYTYTMSAYYNASQKSAISKGNTTLHKEFLATNEKFTRYDIPVGSVIRINTTYRYRPEAWVTLDTLVASEDRPARVTAGTTVVDAAWWADWGYRAFNVQTKTSGTVMTEDGANALRIYVPVETNKYSELEDEDVAYLEAMGLDPDEYMILNFEYFVNAYYNSTGSSDLITGDTLSKRYIATEILTRDDLVIGSVIRITKEGYQYRPDAWTELDKKTSGRPGNVTTEAVIVTEEWWGNFNYRGFNISKTVTSNVTEDDVSALKIYVKVK